MSFIHKYREILHERGIRLRSILYAVVLIGAILIVGKCRQNSNQQNFRTTGETMGTFYEVLYIDPEKRVLEAEIDSVFGGFNQSLSTYIPSSEISRYNDGREHLFESSYFYPVLEASKLVYETTDGVFDPTVKVLVNEWGFGAKATEKVDSSKIDSLKEFVGFDKVLFNKEKVGKKDPRVQLDFGAIAKGYGADVLGEYFESIGIKNYFINIGGEIRARGLKPDDHPWMAGVEDPKSAGKSNFGEAYNAVMMINKSIATSGDYRNYKESGGTKYGHTIDPRTGYPKQSDMISASVVADNCMTADAFATACMVLGSEKAIQLAKKVKYIDVFFIYKKTDESEGTYMSEGFKKRIVKKGNE